MLANNISELIGHTPLLRLNRLNAGTAVYAKMEMFNPYSVKDRPAQAMLQSAEQAGLLAPGATIIEPTSGNTGIALAMLAAARGYPLILTMPENMTKERVTLLKALGAEVILTPKEQGMKGAIAAAKDLLAHTKGSFMPAQFDNPNNPAAHAQTAAEIWADLNGKVDLFVAGAGTGGTITGIGRWLKEKNPSIEVIAVEPAASPVLSGGSPGPHGLQGIGAGFVPAILDRTVLNRIIPVTQVDAVNTARQLAQKEGVLAGFSGGAALWAALQVSTQAQSTGKNIVVLLPDSGERYLSTDLFAV